VPRYHLLDLPYLDSLRQVALPIKTRARQKRFCSLPGSICNELYFRNHEDRCDLGHCRANLQRGPKAMFSGPTKGRMTERVTPDVTKASKRSQPDSVGHYSQTVFPELVPPNSFVAQGLGGKNARCRPGRIHRRDQRNPHRYQSHQHAVHYPRREGNVINGVDLGRKRQQMVVPARP
jgi:hypothetical protein